MHVTPLVINNHAADTHTYIYRDALKLPGKSNFKKPGVIQPHTYQQKFIITEVVQLYYYELLILAIIICYWQKLSTSIITSNHIAILHAYLFTVDNCKIYFNKLVTLMIQDSYNVNIVLQSNVQKQNSWKWNKTTTTCNIVMQHKQISLVMYKYFNK